MAVLDRVEEETMQF
jgi:hypothetical protein